MTTYPRGYQKTKIRIRIPLGNGGEVHVHPVLVHEVTSISKQGDRDATDATQEIVLRVEENGYAHRVTGQERE